MVDKVSSISEYYVAFSLKCLKVLGLWNAYNDQRKWVYLVYTIFIIFLLSSVRISGYIVMAWTLRHDFLQQTLTLSLASAFLVGLIKNINVMLHYSDIRFIADTLHWERSMICSSDFAVYRDQALAKTMRKTKVITCVWVWVVILNIPVFYVDNLDKNHRTLDDLPLSFTFLRCLLKPLNFFIVLAIDYVTFVILSMTIISNDCLFLSLMLHIETQLKILNFRLRKCTARDFQNSNRLKNMDYHNVGCFNRNSDSQGSTVNSQFIICIQHYQKIFKMVHVLKKVYGFILLPQLLSSMTMITFVGIHVFVTKTVNLSDPTPAVLIALTLSSTFIQLSVYCLGGNSIIAESDRTSSAVYDTDWYLENARFKTTLTIFQSMVKHPLGITVAGLFELSFVTLNKVLTKSYSAMALLQRATVATDEN
ncbi:uncharacterized protein LOC135165330 isoform X1 [Diachasmimorpha longicaudata]|uniref:uncharacterized protein LOC135165330 isoform X1 n=1 Tax=Diachasmimorpha longicaudata TaxID=58733 RepID=UPI0030B8E67B